MGRRRASHKPSYHSSCCPRSALLCGYMICHHTHLHTVRAGVMTHYDSCRTHTCSEYVTARGTVCITHTHVQRGRKRKRKSGKHKVPTGEQTSRGLKTPIRSNLLCPCRPPLLSSLFLYFYPSFFFFSSLPVSPSLPPPMSLSVKSLPQQSASVCVCVCLHDCVCCWRVC